VIMDGPLDGIVAGDQVRVPASREENAGAH